MLKKTTMISNVEKRGKKPIKKYANKVYTMAINKMPKC